MLTFHILTLFPDMFSGPFSESILARALESKKIDIDIRNIRDHTHDKHHVADDSPYGGGAGMVMKAEPVVEAIETVQADIAPRQAHVIYLSPQGSVFNHDKAVELARHDHLVLLCGRYEGIDQRALDLVVNEEISIGDYVLTGGEIPAMVLVDAVSRQVPDVVGRMDSVTDDSFSHGLLDWPHYTRPEVFRGERVPEVLLSGHHAKIMEWRWAQAAEKTRRVRPELYKLWRATEREKALEAKQEKERQRAERRRQREATSMCWIGVTIRLTEDWPEVATNDLAARLSLIASQGWSEEWTPEGLAVWKIYFPTPPHDAPPSEGTAVEETVRAIVAAAAAETNQPYEVESAYVPAQDWMAGHREYFQPRVVSDRFAVAPPWFQGQWPFPDHERLVIYPAMAFGTGSHATTRLALQALERMGCAGRRIFDLGTGSALLTIAAARMDADAVLAADIDADALANARDNLTHNHLDTDNAITLSLGGPETAEGQEFDIIVANILYIHLRPLLPALSRYLAREPEARLILTGFLTAERDTVCADITALGWTPWEWSELEEWSAVLAGRSES